MLFLRSLWAIALGLLAGSLAFMQSVVIPHGSLLFKKDAASQLNSETLRNFAALQSSTSHYYPALLGFCVALGLLFIFGDVKRRARLVPDPLSQPWRSVLPTVFLLLLVAFTAWVLVPLNSNLKHADLITPTPETLALLLKWAQWNIVRVVCALLAFVTAFTGALAYK